MGVKYCGGLISLLKISMAMFERMVKMKKRLLVGLLVGVLAINICKDVVLATSEYNEDLSVNDILTESDINDVSEVENEVEDLFSYSPMQESIEDSVFSDAFTTEEFSDAEDNYAIGDNLKETMDTSKPVQILSDDNNAEASFDTIQAAINAIYDNGESEVTIILKQSLEIDTAVNVGSKHIKIEAGDRNITIGRKKGYKGDLFIVGDGSLRLAAGCETEGNTIYSLNVDGSVDNTNVVNSLVHMVNANGVFIMEPGVILQNNCTSAKGSAILNDVGGRIVLLGGSIIGNETSGRNGGAIFSSGIIILSGSNTDKMGSIIVRNNVSDLQPGNIVLDGSEAYIVVEGTFQDSEINITSASREPLNQPIIMSAIDQKTGQQIISAVDMEGLIKQIHYENTKYYIEVDPNTGAGILKSSDVNLNPTMIPTPTPSLSELPLVTPTPVIGTKKIKLSNKQNIRWTGRTEAVFKFSADQDGRYYIAWNQDKSKIPSFKASDAVCSFAKEETVTVNVTGINAEDGKDVYVYLFAVDESNIKATPLRYTLKASARPTAPIVIREPVVPDVTESIVQGLNKPLAFYSNKYYRFSVIGAGTALTAEQVKNPVEGDVQWRPLYWSTSKGPTAKNRNWEWQIGAKKEINKAKTFKMYVFFEKYVYNDGEWKATGLVQSVKYNFRSKYISGVPSSLTLKRGKIFRLSLNSAWKNIKYESSDSHIVTVDHNGKIKAVGSGKARITVCSNSKKAVCKITVPGTIEIRNVKKNVKVKKGRKINMAPKLIYLVKPDLIRYKTSNEKVATIDEQGVMTAKKKGTTVITIKSGKAVKKCKVKVK